MLVHSDLLALFLAKLVEKFKSTHSHTHEKIMYICVNVKCVLYLQCRMYECTYMHIYWAPTKNNKTHKKGIEKRKKLKFFFILNKIAIKFEFFSADFRFRNAQKISFFRIEYKSLTAE